MESIIFDKQIREQNEKVWQLSGKGLDSFMSLRDSSWQNKKKVEIDDYSLLDSKLDKLTEIIAEMAATHEIYISLFCKILVSENA